MREDADLLVEFSPQSGSNRPAGGGQGRGGAEVKVGRMVQDHTAGPMGISDTAALTLLISWHLVGIREVEFICISSA